MKRQLFQKRRGSALIELAISFWVLWALFTGVYQFGSGFYTYNVLMASVANAAQIGSGMDYDTGSPSTLRNQIKNMVVYGDINAAASPLIRGINTGNVVVDFNTNAGGIPHDVTVYMTNYQIDTLFYRYTMPDKPRVTAKFTGRIVCASC